MEIESLHDLFVYELRGAYRMERQLVDALDEMAANATNDRIARAFADHRDETEEHVIRVQSAFEACGADAVERDCRIVEALDEERRAVEDVVADPDLLNMYYLGAGLKTERIEITTYESLLRAADRLELDDGVTDPLEDNLDGEESAFRELEAMTEASDLKSLWEKLLP